MLLQVGMPSAGTQADLQLPADSAVSERGLDDFDAWDEDTQKQWKRFMKGSRSQEVSHSCPTAVLMLCGVPIAHGYHLLRFLANQTCHSAVWPVSRH